MKLNIDEILIDETFKAIQTKRTLKSSEEFLARIDIVLPTGQIISSPPVSFSSPERKRNLMRALSIILGAIEAQAAIITTDARYLNHDAFVAYFEIKDSSREAFMTEYQRILAAHGNSMSNLPRQLWKEALCVTIVGKDVSRVALTEYTIESGQYVFKPIEFIAGNVEVNLLPQWWT